MDLPKGVSRSWLSAFARERGEETFRRMWLLEQRGFFRETKAAFQPGSIQYEPYAESLPTILLYPDGKVVGIRTKGHPINPDGDEGERDRIYNLEDADIQQFDRWIGQIAMPNPWQRMKKFRDDVRAWGCLIILLGIGWLISSVVLDFLSSLLGFRH